MNKLMTTLVGATAVLSLVAFAQGSAHAQRGNGGGGFGGFAGGFGGQRGGGLMQMGLSNLPVDVLVKGLKLTDDQKTKVDDVQKKIREAQRAAFGGGNNPFGGGAGGGNRPDPAQLQEMMTKMQEDRKKNDAQIEAVLTDDQKKALPAFLKDVQTFQTAQLPLALVGDLKLTDDQKTKMAAVVTQIQKIAQEKRQEAMDNQDFQSLREIMTQTQTALKDKTRALLTADQKAMVEKYEKENPNQGFGGRGGRGGAPGAPGAGGQGGRGGRGGNGGGNPPPTQNGNGAPPPRF
jgi:Spy/CpxP family protein refolding chaperone